MYEMETVRWDHEGNAGLLWGDSLAGSPCKPHGGRAVIQTHTALALLHGFDYSLIDDGCSTVNSAHPGNTSKHHVQYTSLCILSCSVSFHFPPPALTTASSVTCHLQIFFPMTQQQPNASLVGKESEDWTAVDDFVTLINGNPLHFNWWWTQVTVTPINIHGVNMVVSKYTAVYTINWTVQIIQIMLTKGKLPSAPQWHQVTVNVVQISLCVLLI